MMGEDEEKFDQSDNEDNSKKPKKKAKKGDDEKPLKPFKKDDDSDDDKPNPHDKRGAMLQKALGPYSSSTAQKPKSQSTRNNSEKEEKDNISYIPPMFHLQPTTSLGLLAKCAVGYMSLWELLPSRKSSWLNSEWDSLAWVNSGIRSSVAQQENGALVRYYSKGYDLVALQKMQTHFGIPQLLDWKCMDSKYYYVIPMYNTALPRDQSLISLVRQLLVFLSNLFNQGVAHNNITTSSIQWDHSSQIKV
jgi:hypothetical protein